MKKHANNTHCQPTDHSTRDERLITLFLAFAFALAAVWAFWR